MRIRIYFWVRKLIDRAILPLVMYPEHDPRCILEIELAFQRGRKRGHKDIDD